MSSADIVTADEVVRFFEASLREEGFDDAQIAHATDHQRQVEQFYVRQQIGNEQLCFNTTFDLELTEPEMLRKRIAQQAKDVAEQFREKMVDTFEWDGRTVRVSPYEGGWAKCMECGTKAHFPIQALTPFTEDAELSCPNPRPRDRKRAVAELSGHNETLFKMYLVGRLREECDHNCSNHKYNYRDKSPPLLRQMAGD